MSYTVPLKKGASLKILSDCSGQIYAGQLCAIMGPSGCGKTTLLDALANRVDGTRPGRKLEGSIEIMPNQRIRYVQQEESLVGVLTVRETCEFAARITGAPLSRVEEIISELGLSSCAVTQVGTIFSKGISGGQKRRLSIAVELMSNPSLLFLDEPTSGLDSASALHVLQLLRSLCDDGMAIVCTLHQPSHAAWELLSTCSFLSNGKCVYFGDPGPRLVDFLEHNGYPVPQFANVPDHALSIINADFAATGLHVADVDALVAAYEELVSKENEIERASGVASEASLEKNSSSLPMDASLETSETYTRASLWVRYTLLCGRGAKELSRDPGALGVRLAMYTLLSFVIGVMFLNLGNSFSPSSINSRIGVLFYVAAFMVLSFFSSCAMADPQVTTTRFLCLEQVFMSVAVLPFFVNQRAVFTKERCNGAYGVPEYVLANFTTAIPGVFLLALIASLLVVLPAELNGFGIYLSTLFLSLVVAESFMALVAAIIPHYIIGIALAAGIFGFFMVSKIFGGPAFAAFV